jgi:tetratricopeptide (TPR) repeat protein
MDGGLRLCAECSEELREQKRDSDEIVALFEEAWASLQQDESARAIRALQKLLRRDPVHAGAHETLILAYGQQGKFDRAIATMSTMHRVASPVLDAVKARGRGRAAVTAGLKTTEKRRLVTRPSIERPTVEPGADLLSLALFYRQLHRLELAEQVLAKVMRAVEVPPEAHLVLGSVYRAQGKPRLALAQLKKARAAGGAEHAAISYEMGLCHEMLGQLKKASSYVSAAIALEPDNPHMHLSLGMLNEKQGRPRLARRAYRVASSLNQAFAPALVDISFRLGLEAVGEGNMERAMTEFGHGVSETPHFFAPGLLGELGHVLSQLVEAEQFSEYIEDSPALQQLSDKTLESLEEIFAMTSRLAFFVGLSYYWDAACDTVVGGEPTPPGQYEPVEPEASWLEGFGPSGRLLRGATLSPWRRRTGKPRAGEDGPSSAEALLGLPSLPFEFVFEEWLDVQSRLPSPRIAERPLVSPEVYQKLLEILAAGMSRGQLLLEGEGVVSADDEPESQEKVELGLALWATIIESYLLREALEACRRYPRAFLDHVASAERFRKRRVFSRATRELEAAVRILPQNASIQNFLCNMYIREGRFQEAAETCQSVLRFTPHYMFQAAAYNDLGYCMVELGQNLNLAMLYTEKARELSPQVFDIHVADTVAWLHHKEGRNEEALELIEKVVESAFSEETAHVPTSIHFYHYGHILQALGREREAQEAFNTALELEVDPESDWGITRRLRKERKKTR